MTQRSNLIALSLAVALSACLLPGPSASASGPGDLLKLIPDDAWGFAVVRSLDRVDHSAAILKAALDLPIPPAVTPMILGQLFGASPAGAQVATDRPVGLMMLDIQKFGAAGMDQAIVLLLPAKEPKSLLKALEAGDPEEGFYTCTVQGQALSAAIRDPYVLFGRGVETLKAVLNAKKNLGEGAAKARLSVLEESDVYLSVSVRNIPAGYKSMATGFIRMATAATDPEGNAAKQFEKLFDELEAIDIGVGLSKDGLALRFLVIPQKETDLESLMRDTKNTDTSLLAVLPREKYLFAMGMTGGYSEHSEKFGQQNFLSGMFAAGDDEGIDKEAIKTLDAELLKLVKAVGPSAFCISALPGGTQGMFGITAVVETSDPKAFLGGIRKIYKTLWTLSDDEDFEQARENFVHKVDSETIAGNKTDTITVKIKGFTDMLELEEEDLKTVEQVLGKDVVLRFGVVGQKHFVCSFGGGKARFEKICKAVTSGVEGSLAEDKGIGSLSRRLPTPRSSEIYIAVDNILQAVKSLMKAMGEEDEMPFELPTIDAPLALGGVQVGGVQRGDLIVPMKLVTSVKKIIDAQAEAEMAAFDEDEDEEEGNDDGDGDDEAREDDKD